jgi:hypothetical protein
MTNSTTKQYSVVRHLTGYNLLVDGVYYSCKDVFTLWLRLKQLGVKQ